MAVRVDAKLEGMEKCLKRLKEIGDKRIAVHRRKAVRAAGNVVLREVRARVPVRTGALRRNLKLRVGKRLKKWSQIFIPLPEREKLGIAPGSKWYYPAILEYTTNPFLRVSFDAKKQAAIDEMASAFKAGIEAEGGGNP